MSMVRAEENQDFFLILEGTNKNGTGCLYILITSWKVSFAQPAAPTLAATSFTAAQSVPPAAAPGSWAQSAVPVAGSSHCTAPATEPARNDLHCANERDADVTAMPLTHYSDQRPTTTHYASHSPGLSTEDIKDLVNLATLIFRECPPVDDNSLGNLWVLLDGERGKKAGVLPDLNENAFIARATRDTALREDCKKAMQSHVLDDLLRNSSIIRIEGVKDVNPLLQSAVEEDWGRPYVGDYANTFVDSINETLCSPANQGGYSNLGSIIQSSGYGKSRMVDEVSDKYFTFPFNVRPEKEKGSLAYPPPDDSVRDYFTDPMANSDNARLRDSLFFFHLFLLTQETLDAEFVEVQALPHAWRDWLKQSTHPGWGKDRQRMKGQPRGVNRSVLYEEAINRYLKTHVGSKRPCWDDIGSCIRGLEEAVIGLLKRLGAMNTTGLTLFLYFDEVHSLFGGNTVAQIYSAPPSHPSPMQILGLLQLQRARRLKVTITDLVKISYLATLGRPLWSVLRAKPQQLMHLAIGKLSATPVVSYNAPIHTLGPSLTEPPRYTKSIAITDNEDSFVPDSLAAFAAVSTRVLIDVETRRETARRLISMLVCNHLRTVFLAPAHREYMRTGTPSEPILAEAAAVIMHESQVLMVKFLEAVLASNLIEKGERGELVARALLIMAIDRAIHMERLKPGAKPLQSLYDKDLPVYHRTVSVKSFIEALVSGSNQNVLLKSRPLNISSDMNPATFEEAFKHGYVCFTHFVRSENATNTTAFLAFTRGAALQFSFDHSTWDIGIPVAIFDVKYIKEYKGVEKVPLSRARWTMLLFSIKARGTARPASYTMNPDSAGFWTALPPQPGEGRQGKKRKHTENEDEERNLHDSVPVAVFLMELDISGDRARSKVEAKAAASRTMARETGKADASRATTKTQVSASQTTTRKIKAKDTASPATTRAIKQHSRYAFTIVGCSSSVYSVIDPSEKDSYRAVLSAGTLLDEHPLSHQKGFGDEDDSESQAETDIEMDDETIQTKL
ncbi:hypothetical protein GGX14DRAFT_384397 [Mycena pura]|uniref:Uncharacterized protein n=1 Tax=Mycena pura TaxID=153505 RepID=A0AAD7E6S5_9AGAR|nr:hypothetical protein GGX14DRAFT_384397 [Mycena pura]